MGVCWNISALSKYQHIILKSILYIQTIHVYIKNIVGTRTKLVKNIFWVILSYITASCMFQAVVYLTMFTLNLFIEAKQLTIKPFHVSKTFAVIQPTYICMSMCI